MDLGLANKVAIVTGAGGGHRRRDLPLSRVRRCDHGHRRHRPWKGPGTGGYAGRTGLLPRLPLPPTLSTPNPSAR